MPLKKPIKKKQGLQKKKSTSVKKTPVKKVLSRAARSAKLLRIVRRARPLAAAKRPHQLERHENNPIIEPREGNYWEMKATFNPGAIYADHRVHLLYRAIGGDDVSVLGYASSGDGVSFEERLSEPAYVPLSTKDTTPKEQQKLLEPAYFSGGGWNGGCEDPRLTLIDDVVYLTYTAFDGWGSIRIALSSIAMEDFLNKNWKWKKPAMISPPYGIHKNWSVFPEKINGKFAILHGITPNIMVEYRDSLNFENGEYIDSKRPPNEHVRMRMGVWDSWIRGAGPPPLKTKEGWILFYHAMDLNDPNRYKLGAMLLDLNDPTKVLYRSQEPILEPDLPYENEGFKSGVVYACGAVIMDDTLFVYYGGADAVTCVAMANLHTFLSELKTYGTPRLRSGNKPNTRTNGRS
ncbi:MAG TPA: hypothetical protein VIJ29_01505 [Candidatus Paceibacterota bacterium]